MRAELMRYRTDGLSRGLALLALALDACFLILIYSHPDLTGNGVIGIDILYNILYMLIVFLTSEKLKTYTRKWCFVSGVFGLIQFARIFYLPMYFLRINELVGFSFVRAILYLAVSGALMIAACITSYIKSKKLHEYMASLNNASQAQSEVAE